MLADQNNDEHCQFTPIKMNNSPRGVSFCLALFLRQLWVVTID